MLFKLILQGTYKELMDSEGAFAEFINEHSTSQGDDSEETVVTEKTIDQVNQEQCQSYKTKIL